MSISANRGEHSEVLAFLRILHQGRVQVADKFGEPRPSWLKVSSIERPSDPAQKYLIRGDEVIVIGNTAEEIARLSRDSVGSIADAFFQQIKEGKGSSFVCPACDDAFRLLKLVGLKATAGAKSDLRIEVISPVFQDEVLLLDFSIKSEIGGLPTLLNAGATKFEYRVEGCSADEAIAVQEAIPRKNDKEYPGPKRLLPALVESEGSLVFETVVDPVFEENLKMIDTAFPDMLAAVLAHAYQGGTLTLRDAIKLPALINELSETLKLSRTTVARLIEHKIKELLRQSALGMSPGQPWNGQVEAHGGWIIVKDSGNIVCFHLVNDDDFRDYLLAVTKFETPSMTRHHAGYIYKQPGSKFAKLRLSLQVRLVN